jgi:ABC-type sugar transport system ATPase subunit
VFNQGRIEQVGAPMDLYQSPANTFVAQFLGSPKINLLGYEWDAALLELSVGLGKLKLNPATANALQDRLKIGSHLGIRPEFIELRTGDQGLPGVIEFLENLGDVVIAYVTVNGLAEPIRIKVRPDALNGGMGGKVGLIPDWSRTLIFGPDGQQVF